MLVRPRRTCELLMRCARKGQNMNRSMQVVLALVLTGAGCNKVAIKQDTPQATVATMVKLFAAGDDKHWAEVVDPAVSRSGARIGACGSAIIKFGECTQALIARSRSSLAPRGPDGCGAKVEDCTCGPVGNNAAAKAMGFDSTYKYDALKASKLDPTACTIAAAKTLTQDALDELNNGFWDGACTDMAKSDEFATVTLTCAGGEQERLAFILHKRADKWMVAGFGADTDASLYAAVLARSAEGAADKRRQELNKDMK